jgi:hypothetical protein
MTMIELFEKLIAEQWTNALRDIGYATGAIALFQAYTGLGPKQLPGHWRLLPSFLLTAVLLGIDCRTAGYTWPVTIGVAIIASAVIGAPAGKIVHDVAQRVGRRTLGRLVKTSAAALVLLSLGGCAGSFEEARLAGLQARTAAKVAVFPSERCVSLDNQHRTWGGVAKVSAVLAGAQGLSTIPVEDKTARIGLAAGTAVTAAAAAGAQYVSESAAESWARECSWGAQ